VELKPAMQEAEAAYARWLEIGTRFGLALLVLGFAAYVLGLVPPQVPFADLPRLWSLPAAQYLAAAGVPEGWGWLRFVQRGDYLNYCGVAVLVSITAVCYLRLLAAFAGRERAYFWIAVVQVAVLVAAASGLVH
jgi:hypothetical protein